MAVGLAMLFIAGEGALRGAIGLAQKLGVSPAMIGLTVVGFGTSAPELVVTLDAALQGQSALAIGNVVGSNISNLLLILGVGAVISPLTCEAGAAKRDAGMMIGTAIILVALGMTGEIVRWQGAIMVAMLVGILFWSYRCDRRTQKKAAADKAAADRAAAEAAAEAGTDPDDIHVKELEEVGEVPQNIWVILALNIVGLAGLLFGAHLLVDGATGIAYRFGVPQSIVGLTLVALGTSLPELAATVVAALRHHTDVAIANVMGSCVFNVLSILGITAIVQPLVISPDIQAIDLWVMLAASLLVMVLLIRACTIGRFGGAVLLLAYVAYIGSMAVRFVPAI
ncbi:calcium/sodium antiporter [Marivibrio halodurans]|uniref:Calcium/sodium antiporter n=1 Tax=Marivibrio halodurans TaxID=2039722 RepID=A0A8J7S017_9PROT|nr:calcium/sodium antiporter [Marivibrio halodurans]